MNSSQEKKRLQPSPASLHRTTIPTMNSSQEKKRLQPSAAGLPRNQLLFFGLMILFCLTVVTNVINSHEIFDHLHANIELQEGFNAPPSQPVVVQAAAVETQAAAVETLAGAVETQATTVETLKATVEKLAATVGTLAAVPREPVIEQPQQYESAWGNVFPQTYFGPLWPESFWPTKTPRQLFGDRFDSCKVEFKDRSMATCHLAAFGGNFGDLLGPDIVKRAVEYRFGCDASNLTVIDFEKNLTGNVPAEDYPGPCLWSVGSVMRYVRAHDHIFGTGMIGKWKLELKEGNGACIKKRLNGWRKFKNVTLYSVRGQGTVEMLREYCYGHMQIASHRLLGGRFDDPELNITENFDDLTPAGDAGFLVPFLFPEILQEARRSPEGTETFSELRDKPDCVVMHFNDQSQWAKKAKHNVTLNPETTKVLDVIQSWQTMARNITQCRVVSSSSLHGLILADAFGIPARWIYGTASVLPFKFLDYGRSFGIRQDTTHRFKFRDIIQKSDLRVPEAKSYSYRSAYAMKIMENFPFHLFEAVDNTA